MTALVINCIIGSGIFGVPSELTRLLGRAGPLAMLIAGLVVAIILGCLAEVASQFSEPRGPYLYVRTAFGRLAGLQVAWITTEAALTCDLSDDLEDAWERLRETALSFGDRRIYTSHKSIMFSRKSCYFFVRPKKSFLELSMFLGRTLKASQVRRVDRASRSKLVHVTHIRHWDEVEEPIIDWLREA